MIAKPSVDALETEYPSLKLYPLPIFLNFFLKSFQNAEEQLYQLHKQWHLCWTELSEASFSVRQSHQHHHTWSLQHISLFVYNVSYLKMWTCCGVFVPYFLYKETAFEFQSQKSYLFLFGKLHLKKENPLLKSLVWNHQGIIHKIIRTVANFMLPISGRMTACFAMLVQCTGGVHVKQLLQIQSCIAYFTLEFPKASLVSVE